VRRCRNPARAPAVGYDGPPRLPRAGRVLPFERACDGYYTHRGPELLFNFPNEQASPGYHDLGWETVADRVTYFRIDNPAPFLGGSGNLRSRTLNWLLPPMIDGYRTLVAGDHRGGGDHVVESHPDVPTDQLLSLYRRRIPDRLHAHRDRRFYEWRFASPCWHRRTYVASRDGSPLVGIVARTRATGAGVTLTQLADVVPLTGGQRWREALRSLLQSILTDHPHSDVFAVAGSPIPHDLLVAAGFRRNDRPPLSFLKGYHRTHVVRPLSDPDQAASWTRNGRSLTDPSA
jgi:hypothetical protein